LSAARHERRKARDEEVLALHQQGETLWSIAHRLNLTRANVRRIVRPGADHAGVQAKRRSLISPYEGYLWMRWTDGCHNALVLLREIQAQGYTGSYVHLRRALRGWQTESNEKARRVQGAPPTTVSTPAPALPVFAPRRAAWIALPAQAALLTDELLFLEQLRREWPTLESVQRLELALGQLVRRHDHAALDEWLASPERSGIPEFTASHTVFDATWTR
jgi:hypothetical protein